MVQIAAVYDLMGDPHDALEWFERLNMRVPQDPGVLARLGALHARYQDIQALSRLIASSADDSQS